MGFNFNIQRSSIIYILAISNFNWTETLNIPLTIVSKDIIYLGINLGENVQKPYTKIYKKM